MVFYLHTDSNTTNQTVLYSNFASGIRNIRIDSSRDLWVIVHGFEGQWPLPWIQLMTTALLSRGNNVLIPRWTKGTAYPLNYAQACSNGRVVGAIIGRFLKEMKELNKVDYSKTCLIGFSLGVPVAGYAGAWLEGQLRQIVGLDPSGKNYEGADPEDRLDKSDAQLVQCIHTHGAPLSRGGLGTMQEMGDIDIYVNGGIQQPGCPVTSRKDFNIKKFYNIIEIVGCNHLRAPALFTDSVLNKECQYKAYPCESQEKWSKGQCFSCPTDSSDCPLMGYPLDPKTKLRGKFYLSTLISQEIRMGKYCGKNFRVTLVPDRDVKGKIKVVFRNGDQSSKVAKFQRFGSNCTVRVEDDGMTEVDLYKGIGYSQPITQETVLNLNRTSFCTGHYVSSSNREICSFCFHVATILLLSFLLSGRF